MIEEVREIYSRSMFMRALQSEPITWVDRIRAVFASDRYAAVAAALTVALMGGLFAVGAKTAGAGAWSIIDFLRRILSEAATSAYAATADGSILQSLTMRDGVRLAIFAAISIAFFMAIGIMGFSSRADSRKFAADMIKTILGFFVGMATRILD